jgi:S1-C subfamily serine protease
MICCTISAFFGAMLATWMLHSPDSADPLAKAQIAQPFSPGLSANPALESSPANPVYAAKAAELLPSEKKSIQVYESCNRSVVNIDTKSIQTSGMFLFNFESEGTGSGAVLDRQGHILTNFHVVQDAREIGVTLYDGSSYLARKIGEDPLTDIAVLKIDAPQSLLHPVTFGDSTQLLVGQNIYAIGNPFGLERTMTSGMISSLNRSIGSHLPHRKIKQVIQIDAAINPGNSGGPLLDSSGRMIGMNTAIASRTGQNTGVGFAIPVNTILRIVPQLLQDGKVIRADIGIRKIQETPEGLLIAELEPEGAADRSGLQGPKLVREQMRRGGMIIEQRYIDRSTADTIVSVDGQPVKTAEDFIALIESKKPGSRVTVTVRREGRRKDIPVTLDAG